MSTPLAAQLLLTAWLVPCAVFDLRRRRIPNWLTLPALAIALWWAWGAGTLGLALVTLAAGFLAFQADGLGGADGKLATVQAAVSPAALLITGLLIGITFLGLRLAGRRDNRLPAAIWFGAGSLAALLLTLSGFGSLP